MGKALLYLSSVFLVFENTALSAIGGAFTAPLVISLLPLIMLYLAFNYKRVPAYAWQPIVFIFIAGLYSLGYSLFFADDTDLAFLVDRGARLFILNFSSFVFFTFFLCFDYSELKVASKIASFLVVAVFMLNLLSPDTVNSQSFLQGSAAFSPDRMRGYTLEASTFGFQIVTALMLLMIVFNVSFLTATISVVAVLLFVSSKGALLTFLMALAIGKFVITESGRNKSLVLIIGSVTFLVGSYYLILDAFVLDIEKYNSSSTRSVMIFTAIYSSVLSPLGVGFTGYFDQIYNLGPTVIDFMDSLFPNALNFEEVAVYFIRGNVQSVSTKTFFFDWVIYFGWVFIYCFFRFAAKNFKKIKGDGVNNIALYIFMLVSLCFYVPLDGRIIGLLALTTLIKYKKEGTS
ncbi:hypothetical protein [Shewanella sp.]|uniref:hypothetical protein n=1 Tax=Shewanella sp. TaxID=50422 RepID=UPI003A97C240